jgi:hypothetical protein
MYLDNLKICKDILIQQINIFLSQINNLENEVKVNTKNLTNNPKNENENDQISICRKRKNTPKQNKKRQKKTAKF